MPEEIASLKIKVCTLWYMDLVAPRTRNQTHVSCIVPAVPCMLCHQASPVPNILRVCLCCLEESVDY